MRYGWVGLVFLLTAACASSHVPQAMPIPEAWTRVAAAPRIRALAFTSDGSELRYVTETDGRCTLRGKALNGPDRAIRELPFCPDRMRRLEGGALLLEKADHYPNLLITPEGAPVTTPPAENRKDVRYPAEPGIRQARYLPDGTILTIEAVSAGEEIGRIASPQSPKPDKGNGRDLTPPFAAIDSFDVSADRREVVFSAKRKERGNFDIGLVSADGSDVHWIPEDPADETGVEWAPRGNKVSYIVHGKEGDLVRTVHIPTAFQLTVDFPLSIAGPLAWEPAAERYAVVTESPSASPAVEIRRYEGEGRQTLIPPTAKLDLNVDRLGGSATDAILLAPATTRYGEKLPLVVWLTDGNVFAWNDARAALERQTRVAIAVVPRTIERLDSGFWEAARAIPWIDSSRVYVVDAQPRDNPEAIAVLARASAPAGLTLIAAGGSGPPDTWMQTPGEGGSTSVRLPLAAANGVQSFAVGYIADQLKGISR